MTVLVTASTSTSTTCDTSQLQKSIDALTDKIDMLVNSSQKKSILSLLKKIFVRAIIVHKQLKITLKILRSYTPRMKSLKIKLNNLN